MPNEYDPSEFNITGPAATASGIVADAKIQQSTANLASTASVDFDFNTDYNPIFDAYLFADKQITVRTFVRQSSSDPQGYQQVGADVVVAANTPSNPLSGKRMPGSNVRVRFVNTDVAVTTKMSVQVHARSI